jgi:hypothetical protein
MSVPEPRRTRFREVLLAEALAAREHDGPPADDVEALADAHQAASALDRRLAEYTWAVAGRAGLLAELGTLLRGLPALLLVGAALVAASAYAMLGAVVGEGRTIHVVMAFVSLLGLHALALLLWLAALAHGGGGGLPRRLLVLAARRMPEPRRRLLLAAEAVAARAGLTPWAFGCASHLMWLLAFALVAAGLWVAFAFHAFRLGWETTILGTDTFLGFVQVTGWLPERLGLLPSTGAAWQADLAPPERHRRLAWWLIGCTLAYGLLPRLLLAPLCAAMCRWRARRVAIDTGTPWARRLASRFDRLEASRVVDADTAAVRPAGAAPLAPEASGLLAVVGFELPPDTAWPVEPFTAASAWTRRIEGREDERQALMDSVSAAPPARLLLAVDGGTSPDRGTGHLLRALGPEQRAIGLLLLQAPGRRSQPRRWRTWLQDEDLGAVTLLADLAAAQRWAGLDAPDG